MLQDAFGGGGFSLAKPHWDPRRGFTPPTPGLYLEKWFPTENGGRWHQPYGSMISTGNSFVQNMFHTHRVIAKQPNSKMCLVCGLQNEPGLRAAFYELESQHLVGLFTPRNHQQGYPGRLHGGIAASMLDETIGRAIRLSHGDALWGVTIELNVKFRKPIPLDRTIKTAARITKETKRYFEGDGAMILPNGCVAVEARGRYMKMSIDSITDFDFEEQQWKVIPAEEDPEMIELPSSWVSSQE